VSLYIDKSKISYKPDTGTTMDQEWMKFITQHHVQDSAAEWKKTDPVLSDTKSALEGNLGGESQECPPCDELFISTKTKVLFLNQGLNINDIFWKIPITEYWRPHSGVIKKQMKIVSKTPEEYEEYRSKLEGIPYYTESVIKQINNPTARRLKFKDERKITVGLSKKDIMNCRGKVKNAFYNCFAMILRFIHGGMFREIHVKIFNTGKMEIPGILNSEILDTVKTMILEILRANTADPVGLKAPPRLLLTASTSSTTSRPQPPLVLTPKLSSIANKADLATVVIQHWYTSLQMRLDCKIPPACSTSLITSKVANAELLTFAETASHQFQEEPILVWKTAGPFKIPSTTSVTTTTSRVLTR
jgi:hypothetical protein